jgi:hypothetical protein
MPPLPRFVANAAPGSIRGFSSEVAKKVNPVEIRDCVSCLMHGHLDPNGRAGTIRTTFSVRLDRQPGGSGDAAGANLQLQANAAVVRPGQGTTIGQVIVPAAVFVLAHLHPQSTNLLAQLQNVTRSALLRSASGSGTWYFIGVQ